MIDNLSNFCISIICTIMFIIILEMIAPEGKNKKYITFIFGLVVTLTIMEPIMNLFNIDIEEVFASNEFEYEEHKYDDTLYKNVLKKSYEENLVNDVINRLKENGYKVSNVKIEYDKESLEPRKIYLDLEDDDGYIQPVKIEVLKKSENSNVMDVNKIKNIINEHYGIEKNNIFVN